MPSFSLTRLGISEPDRRCERSTEFTTASPKTWRSTSRGLDAGPHTIFVHGRDVHGNWGPFLALEVNAGQSGSGDILYRINAGGPQLAGTPVWAQDTTASPSPFVNAATGNSSAASVTNTINLSHPSIPEGTPMAVFQAERFDPGGGGEMQWNFPVAPGEYLVRLYFAETWSGGQAAEHAFSTSKSKA